MRNDPTHQAAICNLRVVFALILASAGAFLALLSFAASPPIQEDTAKVSLAPAAGSWSIVSSPNTSSAEGNTLNGITCVSASDCWAVGNYYNGSAYLTLIEHWNGSAWTIVASPNTPGTQNNNLYGVACTSAFNCWAVGQALIGGTFRTLIERWDGTSWTIVPSPNGGAMQDILQGVTCVSDSDCWAVGYYSAGPNAAGVFTYPTLIEHWNGAAWSIINSANTSATQNILWGVACTSASNCWTVGYETGNTPVGPFKTLIERWNGSSWTIVNSPNTLPAQNNFLFATTCVSPSDCRAAGYSSKPGVGIAETLVERWDGSAWTIESSPNVSATQNNAFFGVSCPTASDCWAVGYNSATGVIQTLIERWDGTSWTIASSPNTSAAQSNVLNYVACVSAYDCWAVGYYNNGTLNQTLIEHYTAPQPLALVSAASRKIHGNAGPFEINLPLTGTSGVECRTGGANGNYTIVFTFTNPITSVDSASTSCGSVNSRMVDNNDAHRYVVNITGCTGGARFITVGLTGVHDNQGNTLVSVPGIPTGLLLGDTNGNGSVNSSDVSQTKAQSGKTASPSNFREDVTVSGSINSSDISLVKSKSGTALP